MMSDAELQQAWQAFDPDATRRARIDRRVSDWLEAHDSSLTDEWLSLVADAPLRTIAMTAACAATLVIASPLMWLVRALLQARVETALDVVPNTAIPMVEVFLEEGVVDTCERTAVG